MPANRNVISGLIHDYAEAFTLDQCEELADQIIASIGDSNA